MASKRKRIVLTIEEKYKIIQDLESGESTTKLAVIHSIGKSAITDVKKQKRSIENYIQNVEFTNTSTSKKILTNQKIKV